MQIYPIIKIAGYFMLIGALSYAWAWTANRMRTEINEQTIAMRGLG